MEPTNWLDWRVDYAVQLIFRQSDLQLVQFTHDFLTQFEGQPVRTDSLNETLVTTCTAMKSLTTACSYAPNVTAWYCYATADMVTLYRIATTSMVVSQSPEVGVIWSA